jgi:hypothetical protein
MNDTFSEADLAPSDDDRRAKRHDRIERVAVTLAVVSLALVAGGLVALGACAAPFVFRLTPAPFSGQAMGAAFMRFDRIALAASCVVLAVEMLRTWIDRRQRPSVVSRVRRFAAIVFAGCVAYSGMSLSPAIVDLYASGARRDAAAGAAPDGAQGPKNAELDAIHQRASQIAKIEVAAALVAALLHVWTVRCRRPDEDDDEVLAPLPPGPASRR